MRYFIYISKTKVKMLFPQIPKKFLAGLSGELKLSLGVGELTLSSDSDSNEDIYSKALAVEKFLESKNLLGNALDHDQYFRGTHQLNQGLVRDSDGSSLALFGTHLGPVYLAMVGASSSLNGAAKTIKLKRDEHSLSYYEICGLNALLKRKGFAEDDGLGKPEDIMSRTPEAVKNALALMPKSDVRMHYVAKSLKKIKTQEGVFILASPIYVSFPKVA